MDGTRTAAGYSVTSRCASLTRMHLQGTSVDASICNVCSWSPSAFVARAPRKRFHVVTRARRVTSASSLRGAISNGGHINDVGNASQIVRVNCGERVSACSVAASKIAPPEKSIRSDRLPRQVVDYFKDERVQFFSYHFLINYVFVMYDLLLSLL